MRFDEQRRPHYFEQGDDIYGHRLSLVEDRLDEIDNTPSSRAGLDRLSAHQRTRPSAVPSSPPAAEGPHFPEAA